jgi:hypothetical protein
LSCSGREFKKTRKFKLDKLINKPVGPRALEYLEPIRESKSISCPRDLTGGVADPDLELDQNFWPDLGKDPQQK